MGFVSSTQAQRYWASRQIHVCMALLENGSESAVVLDGEYGDGGKLKLKSRTTTLRWAIKY